MGQIKIQLTVVRNKPAITIQLPQLHIDVTCCGERERERVNPLMSPVVIKHPVPDRVKPSIAERQSARMSKITNNCLTRSAQDA